MRESAHGKMVKKRTKNVFKIFNDISCIGGVNLKNITNQLRYFELNCLGSFWLEFSASLCISLILAIIATVICYRYRVYIQYLYLIAVSSRPNAEQQNDNYDFDGFISYSNRDYDWVLNILYKHLTEDMNIAICVHDKDFIPGRSIANEILRCIDQSRKVIFVVTRSFLECDWGNYRVRTGANPHVPKWAIWTAYYTERRVADSRNARITKENVVENRVHEMAERRYL